MTAVQTPGSFGMGAHKARVPVALRGERHILSWAITNTYFQEILGPRTFGSVLNIGAGRASAIFRQPEMFAASEYHTLETPGDVPATYHCSAEMMDGVPDEHYDWVISTAVLEHVRDPWAVARQAMRVTKPGGFSYTLAPFAHQVHVGPDYGDYWRFTPNAMEILFTGCKLREVEVWGDDPIMPNCYAVLVQKPPFDERAKVPYLWLDYPNEADWQAICADDRTQFDIQLFQLVKTPPQIATEMHMLREQTNLSTGVFLPIHQVTRASIDRYARRIGTLGIRGDQSYIAGVA